MKLSSPEEAKEKVAELYFAIWDLIERQTDKCLAELLVGHHDDANSLMIKMNGGTNSVLFSIDNGYQGVFLQLDKLIARLEKNCPVCKKICSSCKAENPEQFFTSKLDGKILCGDCFKKRQQKRLAKEVKA